MSSNGPEVPSGFASVVDVRDQATDWFTHCRIVGEATLELKQDSFERISNVNYLRLCQSFGQLDSVVGAVPNSADQSSLQLITRGELSDEDNKRIAIAASYMIEEAIVNSERVAAESFDEVEG